MEENKNINPEEAPKKTGQEDASNVENKNLDNAFEKLPESKKNLFSSILGWIVVVGLLGTGIYFVWSQWGGKFSSKDIFTRYEPLVMDSLNQQNDTLVQEDFLTPDSTDIIIFDTTQMTDSNGVVLVETLPDSTKSDSELIASDTTGRTFDFFKVNTSYDEPMDSTRSDSTILKVEEEKIKIETERASRGLFEELLLPENPDPEVGLNFNTYAQKNIISSKSVLKLLSMVGKDILLAKNLNDDQDLLDILVESPAIEGILIIDRNGKIVSATNRKLQRTLIKNVMPSVDIQTNILSWYEEDNQRVTTLPLFHPYGKIGSAVLITNLKIFEN